MGRRMRIDTTTAATVVAACSNSGDPPTVEEVWIAMQSLRNTSPGENMLPPALLKRGGRGAAEIMHRTITTDLWPRTNRVEACTADSTAQREGQHHRP